MSIFKKWFNKEKKQSTGETNEIMGENGEPFDELLDCKRMICPRPIFEISTKIKNMVPNTILKIVCTDPAFENDIKAWCSRTKNQLQKVKKFNGTIVAYVNKI